ncbi:hypothetical protein C8Q75DRAFT_735597 [Abortiporus biennis]|nr:hypothetical protein C8Q75DRAFT_735597 [Abortiporus biennis]
MNCHDRGKNTSKTEDHREELIRVLHYSVGCEHTDWKFESNKWIGRRHAGRCTHGYTKKTTVGTPTAIGTASVGWIRTVRLRMWVEGRTTSAVRKSAMGVGRVDAIWTVTVVSVCREITDGGMTGAQASRHAHHMTRRKVMVVVIGKGLEGHGVVQLEGICRHRGTASRIQNRRT